MIKTVYFTDAKSSSSDVHKLW